MLFEQIASNKRKTIYVMFLFFALLVAVGYSIGYLQGDPMIGVIIAISVAFVYIIFTVASSRSIVLKMNHAEAYAIPPHLTNIVENMAMTAQIPMPAIYIINDPAPNAFATGFSPENAAVAVTRGLLEQLNNEELEGVIAHEVSHIRNYDIRLATVAVALTGVFSVLSDLGMRMVGFGGRRNRDSKGGHPALYIAALVLIIASPMVALMINLALSRNREFLADASAVELTRNPNGLISALVKISGSSREIEEANNASLSMYIFNPKKRSFAGLFATHPSLDKRLERLAMM
jgi:heat shock protein HtpX